MSRRRMARACGSMMTLLLGAGCADLSPEPQTTTIPIGALLPLTGSLARHGAAADAALVYAEAQANAYFAAAGATLRVELRVADTASSAEGAFDALRDLADDGVHAFVGPYTSEALARVASLTSRLRTFSVSPYGGAAELAVAEDNLARFVPTNALLARAWAAYLDEQNVQALAFLARSESEHAALRQALTTRFTAAGGQILGTIDITSNAVETNDYRVPLAVLGALLAERRDEFDSNGVAVCLLAYEESTTIVAQAAAVEGLGEVRWLGGEAVSGSVELLENLTAASLARETRLTAPRLLLPAGERTDTVIADVTELLGATPDPYALAAYDAFWSLALTVSQTEFPNDPAYLRFVLPQVLAVYNGATGVISLDDTDDRTSADYEFLQVMSTAEGTAWTPVATYVGDTLVPAATP